MQQRKANRAVRNGYVLLELLLAAGILAGVAMFMGLHADGYRTYYYKLELRLAAQSFAADLRQLQQNALFTERGPSHFLRQQTKNPQKYVFYDLYDTVYALSKRTVFLDRMGYPNVYFANPLSNTEVRFSSAGAPSTSANFILCHKKLPKYRYRLEVQPVTGRVVVHENE